MVVESSAFLSSLIFPVNFGNLSANPYPFFTLLIYVVYMGLKVISGENISTTILVKPYIHFNFS